MKYALVSKFNPNAMQLQSIGWVLGTPASEVKPGCFLMWNFGSIYVVNSIVSETEKTITISTSPKDKSEVYTQKLLKKRLICILSQLTQ